MLIARSYSAIAPVRSFLPNNSTPCLTDLRAACGCWAYDEEVKMRSARTASSRRRFILPPSLGGPGLGGAAVWSSCEAASAAALRMLLYRSRQERSAMIGRDRKTLCCLADHSVKINICPGQNQKHVTSIITRVVNSETDYRRLAVFLLDRFERKTIGFDDVGL